MTEANTRRRLVVIGAIVMALFAGLLTRLWFLQVTGGEQLAVAAQQNRDRTVDVPALRGTIYDSKGNWLARTVPVTTLTVDRQKLTDADRVLLEENLPTLPEFAGKSAVEIGTIVDDPRVERYLPVVIANDPSTETITKVTEHREMFPKVSASRTSVREYSELGVAAANLIGYMGEVNDDELKAYASEKYKTGDSIGKAGVEHSFESELRGTPGVDKVQVDSRGRAGTPITEKKPQAGHDVQLTVDGDVQRIALESLQQGIDGSRRLVDPDTGDYYEPTGGAVVVIDARTGSVVAMASSPNYDPNAFIAHTADAYLKDPSNPLLDRATSAYPPGSTFKMITATAMLKSGLEPDGKNFTLYDPGYFDFGNDQRLYNAGRAELGTVNLPRALTVSSDVYFYRVGNDFWVQYRNEGQAAGHTGDLAGDDLPDAQHAVGNAIQHTATDFGLGAQTGIGFGENEGRIPTYEWKSEYNKSNADRFSRSWLRGDTANLAVGQGDVLVTPLQLALAYATLGNGGTLNVPRVASSVRQSAATLTDGQLGAVDHTIDQQVRHKVDLPPDVRDPIIEGLHGAVNSGDGTAYGPFADYVPGYNIVGKTGTAQGSQPGKDTAWFVGILNPENNPNQPQYVVLAMVEHGGFGAAVAAPIARRVINFLTDPTVVPPPVSVAQPSSKEVSN